jgi:ABC-type transporter Mla subunit MlaD
VDQINPEVVEKDGKRTTMAVVDLKLDKTVDPLPKDSSIEVRPRSALGLKYVELVPGKSDDTFSPGDTVPLSSTSQPEELEDVLSTFDDDMRQSTQDALVGFGDAFAGRGASLNEAIGSFRPFFTFLEPVMSNLADPDTELDQFFLQLGRAAAQAAPVAEVQARLFTDMADTFDAFNRNPEALRQTIEKSPPTLDVSIRSLRVQRPFLADFADLSHRLRPAARQMPVSLPAINRAFKVGTPILPRTVALNRRVGGVFDALNNLFENPNTLLALRDIRNALGSARPLVEFVSPYQSVCNYAHYFLHALGEHQSNTGGGAFGGGTVQLQGVKTANRDQPNTVNHANASRPWDIPPVNDRRGGWNDNKPPRGAEYDHSPAGRLIATPYFPAIDAQGNADCQNGQYGYPNGKFVDNARYGPGYVEGEPDMPTGGNFPFVISDYPVLTGGTYVTRRLGIDNLKDVP